MGNSSSLVWACADTWRRVLNPSGKTMTHTDHETTPQTCMAKGFTPLDGGVDYRCGLPEGHSGMHRDPIGGPWSSRPSAEQADVAESRGFDGIDGEADKLMEAIARGVAAAVNRGPVTGKAVWSGWQGVHAEEPCSGCGHHISAMHDTEGCHAEGCGCERGWGLNKKRAYRAGSIPG